jgi:hypothetical protein
MSQIALRVTPEAFAAPAVISRWRSRALAAGVVFAAAAAMMGFLYGWNLFLRAWLTGFLFWLGLTTGSLALLMLQYVTGGNWGRMGRRIWEAAASNLWLMFLCWLPIALGMKFLFSWVLMPPEQLGIDKVRYYLNATGFWARGIIYFAGWGLLYWRLAAWSKKEEAGQTTPEQFVGIQNLSGFGIVFYGAAVTFASIDWAMSLDPKWWSTVWGMLFMVGQVLSTFCFTIILLVRLARMEPLSRIFRVDYLHDFGKLMFAFVVLWAYLSFSQWLIIWAGNLLSEIRWYLMRLAGGWQYVGPLLVFVHFVFPFALLLSRSLKRDARRLMTIALLVILVRVVDLFWLTAPNFYNAWAGAGLRSFRWADGAMYVVCPLAMGGIWLFFFFNRLEKRALMPVNDPHFVEMLEAKHG